jgi:hypothetical protein
MTRGASRSSWLLVVAVLAAAFSALAEPKPAAPARPPTSPHRASITESMECSSCHSQTSWDVHDETAGKSAFDHARTGFPLSGRHRVVSCADCHRSDRAITRECVGCHRDAHQRQLGQACDTCHSATSWSSVSGIRVHRATRLPLSGMHVLAACSECHVRASDNQWRGVPADCYACHAGDYNRVDIHPLHRGVPGDPSKPALPKNCAGCHRTSAWAPAFAPTMFRFRATSQSLSTFQHDAVFPISHGKHRGTTCADCHLDERAPRIVLCTGCHAHDAVRLQAQHRTVGTALAGCLHCHPGGARR